MKVRFLGIKRLPVMAAELERLRRLGQAAGGGTAAKGVDLVSRVKAFYDVAMTQPIEERDARHGVYHLPGPRAPLTPFNPWGQHPIYFRVEVTNHGLWKSAGPIANHVVFSSTYRHFVPGHFSQDTRPVTIAPGETVQYNFSVGPLPMSPDSGIETSTTWIAATADHGNAALEDDETNNSFRYDVSFLWQ